MGVGGHDGLGHLGEGHHALLHPGPPGGEQRHDREPGGGGPLEGPGHPFAHSHTHRAPEDVEGARDHGDGTSGDRPPTGEDGLSEARDRLPGAEGVEVAGEAEGVPAHEAGVPLLGERAVAEQGEAGADVHGVSRYPAPPGQVPAGA